MPVYCTVCMNNTRLERKISFFSYPKDVKTLRKWLKIVGREDLFEKLIDNKIRPHHRICEDHFEKDCIQKLKNTRRILKETAFPTLNLPKTADASSSQKIYCNLPIEKNLSNVLPIEENLSNPNMDSRDVITSQETTFRSTDTDDSVSTENTSLDISVETFQHRNIVEDDITSSQSIKIQKTNTQGYQSIDILPIESIKHSNANRDLKNKTDLQKTIFQSTETDMDLVSTENTSFNISMQTFQHRNIEDEKSGRPAVTSMKREQLEEEFRDAKKSKNIDLTTVRGAELLKLCDKYMTKGISQILRWQIDLKAGHSENQFSQGFISFALNLYYSGPAAYKFLSNTFSLPPVRNLKKIVMPIGTKMDERLLHVLKMKVDRMSPKEKICSICVDCMSLKSSLFYDITRDRVVGFHEINGIQIPEPARYVIVIMIRGIVKNWKQPIAYAFLSQWENHPGVNDWIDNIIISLLNIGLDIRVYVSNSNLMSVSKVRSVNKELTYFEANGRKIYYMFDVPHLAKSIRNNLITCNFIFDDKVAKWSHIEEIYMYNGEQDKKQRNRLLAPRLTDMHINPNKFQKTSVKLAAQVLSRTVASAINTHVDINPSDTSARDTAEFVNKINNLFDILNSNVLRSSDKFKRAFRGDSYQINFLLEMLVFFKNLRLVRIDGETDVTNIMNFIEAFQVSIKSLLQLFEDLESDFSIKFLYTRRLNLDCVKIFFAKVREAGGNCQTPTPRTFSIVFKKMFITNILKKPTGIKCCQDFDSLLIKREDRKKSIFSEVSQYDHMTTTKLKVATTDYRFDLPERNALVYVSTYLYRKCIEQHKCDYNQFNNGNIFLILPPDSFIKFIELLEREFCEYFYFQDNIVNIGTEILKQIRNYVFDMPCECFPLDYLKKLYVRFRIYQIIKINNQLLKNSEKVFTVSNLYRNI